MAVDHGAKAGQHSPEAMAEPAIEIADMPARTIADLFAATDSRFLGLTQAEAARRLRQAGPNRLDFAARDHPLILLVGQFRSPLILILIGAAALTFTIGETTESLIIAGIVLASSALAFFQEYRASDAMRVLRARMAIHARVVRDGELITVPAADIAVGDIIELASGSLVPADCVLLESLDLNVDEAALTGESFPVEKVAPGGAPLTENSHLYMGTSVRSGKAKALVVTTGAATRFGKVAQSLSRLEPETNFAREIRRFGMLMTQIMLVMLGIILPINLVLGRPLLETLLFSAALAVGLTPELLPAIVSITLARGAQSLSRSGVLVRRLVAIENLGAIDVLCTDKTGTLTEGVVTLRQAISPDGSASTETLELAAINAALQTGMPNAIDDAIRGVSSGPPAVMLDQVPYDFERKRLSVMVRRAGASLLICKGAVSSILRLCDRIRENGAAIPLSAERLRLEQDRCADWGKQGLRVLAVAEREMGDSDRCGRDDEAHLTLVGYLHFSDELKHGVPGTIAELRQRGVNLKILTGDNRYVAARVASDVGVSTDHLLVGSDVARLTDRALAHRLTKTDLFAELTPDQKERVVVALRRNGRVVGYLGDGINDAPPLRAADLGISVDTGVEAAKEAADVVLLERDLRVLLKGIVIGRTAFANTMKYVAITTSANLGNMVSMALASLFLPFLPMLAKQILLNNSLSDLPMLAISGDRVDPGVLARPGRWDLRTLLRSMIVYGLTSSAFDVLVFCLLVFAFRSSESQFQTSWFVFSLLTEIAIIWVMRTRHRFYLSTPSELLFGLSATVALVAVLLPVSPAAAPIGLVPLPFDVIGSLLLMVVAYTAASELLKWILNRQRKRTTQAKRRGSISAR